MWGKVAIGTRLYADPRAEFFVSFAKLIKDGLKLGDELLEPVIRWNVVTALTMICRRFLKSSCDSLFLFEDDIVFTVDDFARLRGSGKDFGILSALFVARRYPFNPQVFRSLRRSRNSIRDLRGTIEVEAVPFGFALIRRPVIEKIAQMNGQRIAQWGVCDECITFCQQARGFGFKVGMNTDISVGHCTMAQVYWDRETSKPEFKFDDQLKDEQ